MDLKNFPMDVQTCTMQLESCECYVLSFWHGRCSKRICLALCLQLATPWMTWSLSGWRTVRCRCPTVSPCHSSSWGMKRSWVTAPNTTTPVSGNTRLNPLSLKKKGENETGKEKKNMMRELVRNPDWRERFKYLSSSAKQRQESDTEGKEEKGTDRRVGEGGGPARWNKLNIN